MYLLMMSINLNDIAILNIAVLIIVVLIMGLTKVNAEIYYKMLIGQKKDA